MIVKCDPADVVFCDTAGGLAMMLVGRGHYKGWLAYWYGGGRGGWVMLREATAEDLARIAAAPIFGQDDPSTAPAVSPPPAASPPRRSRSARRSRG